MEKETEKAKNHCRMKWVVALMKLIELIIDLVRKKKKSEKETEFKN